MQLPNFNFLIWKLFIILTVSVFLTSSLDKSQNNDSEQSRTTIMNVYFYNWTNPEDINNSSVKPKFEELGPYRYKKVQQKSNDGFLNDYYFDEENSPNHESDMITTINMVSLRLAYAVKDGSLLNKLAVNHVTSAFNLTVYTQKSVRELTFEGYNDPVLDVIAEIESTEKNKRFGWFYGKNESVTSNEEYYLTSADGKLKFGLFRDTQDSSDDLQEILKSEKIQFSFPDTCKPLQLNFDVKILSQYKYSLGSTLFHYEKLDLSQCGENVPIYTSLPHFLRAGFSYLDAVEGVKPSKSKHETFIIIQADSKTVLDSITRVQVNVLLQPIEHIRLYASVPEVMMPVLWVEHILADSDYKS